MKIGAVIVTYNPENSLDSLLERLLKWNLEKIIIVDNASNEKIETYVEEIEIINNSENLGIGKALNQGIERLEENSCDWVITFDQDSIPEEKMLKKLIETLKDLKDENIKSCGPIYKNMKKKNGLKYKECYNLITSGNLIEISTWRNLGKFKEEWFIDCIDTEYCLRLKKNGYRIIQNTEAVLNHQLGKDEKIQILGLEIKNKVHSSFRRYYIVRNHIKLFKEYYSEFPYFLIKRTIIISLLLLKSIILGKNKKENIKNIILAIKES